MPRLFVMRVGTTVWEAQQRVESAAGSPLTAEAAAGVAAEAGKLPDEIRTVYCGGGEGERQTAELVAGPRKLKVKALDALREFDYGLWQGLTFDEIRRRQPRAYRQWVKAPGDMRPPGGETLQEALDRLARGVQGVLRRHRRLGRSALLVLGPVAAALVKCLLLGQPPQSVWQHVDKDFAWCGFDVPG